MLNHHSCKPINSADIFLWKTSLNPMILHIIYYQRILQANNVSGHPQCDNRIHVRKVLPEVIIIGEEVGKFIFPPGGSFVIFLSNPETSDEPASATLGFSWWEEEVNC